MVLVLREGVEPLRLPSTPREGGGGAWGQVLQQPYLSISLDICDPVWISSRCSYLDLIPQRREAPSVGMVTTTVTPGTHGHTLWGREGSTWIIQHSP